MNGTSMASPNGNDLMSRHQFTNSPSIIATGGSACLLSAMKALNIKISPFRFRLSIENSANFPCCETEEEKQQEHFSYGTSFIMQWIIWLWLRYVNNFRQRPTSN